jgi:nucleotide-binding universal stress UspA family protein
MTPFRTILFAADFSERSREAFRVACSLANEQKTRLFVVHVLEKEQVGEPPVAFDRQGVPIALGAGIFEDPESVKNGLREFYTPTHPIDLFYDVRAGEAAEELLQMAGEIGCDLIVLGTHGRSGVRRLLTGSVAEGVLRKAQCPVLALRTLELTEPARGLRVVLHPSDFSPRSEAALSVARALAREHGAQLVVLHVAPPAILMSGTMAVGMEPSFYVDALDEVRKRVEGPDLKYPVTIRLSRGEAAAEILREAEELGASLIVMGTHGRTGLPRLVMGSVAEAVIRESRCPVLGVKMPLPASAPISSPREPVTV